MYDMIIKNASIVDGTGRPAFDADAAVLSGKIVMNPSSDAAAKEIVDAKGLILSPGFIDAHCHTDETIGNYASNLCKTSQGITTEISGHCGESLYPVSGDPEKRAMLADFMKEYLSSKDCGYVDKFSEFTTLENFLSYAGTRNCTTNYALFTGHIALRIAAMGFENRKPTSKELEKMKELLREGMEHGSMGLSSGLIYSPSCYADEDELVELCKVVAEYNGLYATHLRNEAGDFEKAVREAINIAERSECRLNLSHHKVCGSEYWGATAKTLKLVHEANERGVKTFVDVYPYTAAGNYLNICLPADFFANGPEKMYELLKKPEIRAELKPRIEREDGRYRQCGSFEKILICSAPNTPESVNKTVAEYAKEIGKDPFETYFDLVCANGQRAMCALFAMSDEDLERTLMDDLSVICTDSFAVSMENTVHPRAFGSFPKCLGYYVREKKLMSLEKMVHKMTQAPAKFLGLANKGVIQDGFDADLVLFNPETVRDRANYSDSHALSTGIERVIVHGETVYLDQRLTGKYPGSFIPRA